MRASLDGLNGALVLDELPAEEVDFDPFVLHAPQTITTISIVVIDL